MFSYIVIFFVSREQEFKFAHTARKMFLVCTEQVLSCVLKKKNSFRRVILHPRTAFEVCRRYNPNVSPETQNFFF